MKDNEYVICYEVDNWIHFLTKEMDEDFEFIWSGQKSENIRTFDDLEDLMEVFEELIENGFYPLTVMTYRNIDKAFENVERIEEWWKLKEK